MPIIVPIPVPIPTENPYTIGPDPSENKDPKIAANIKANANDNTPAPSTSPNVLKTNVQKFSNVESIFKTPSQTD